MWRRRIGGTTVERFVALLVGGGLAMPVGLWVMAGAESGSTPWVGGSAVAVLGAGCVAAGIAAGIDRLPVP